MHRSRPVGESFDHCPAGWIRQSRKRGIQLIHNRMVVDCRSMSSVNFAIPDFCSLIPVGSLRQSRRMRNRRERGDQAGRTPVFSEDELWWSSQPRFWLNPAHKWDVVKNSINSVNKTPSPPFFPCRNPRVFCHLPVSSAMPPANLFRFRST